MIPQICTGHCGSITNTSQCKALKEKLVLFSILFIRSFWPNLCTSDEIYNRCSTFFTSSELSQIKLLTSGSSGKLSPILRLVELLYIIGTLPLCLYCSLQHLNLTVELPKLSETSFIFEYFQTQYFVWH